MSEYASQQPRALGRVADLFEKAGVAYWLFGGWAVDFHASSVTRAHDDIAVAVWRDDLPRIAELLEADGWGHTPAVDEHGGTGYEREGVRLELTFLARDAGGIFTPLRAGQAPWPEEGLADDVREVAGARARIISLEALRRGKSAARDDPADAAKDRADYLVLSRLPGPDSG